MKAVLLVGHGSRDPEGNEQVRQTIKELKPQLDSELISRNMLFRDLKDRPLNKEFKHVLKKGQQMYLSFPLWYLQQGIQSFSFLCE